MSNAPSLYSDYLARRLAIFSAAAYAPISQSSLGVQIEKWSFPNLSCNLPRIEVYRTFDVTDESAVAFISLDHDEKSIVVAFEGTADIIDWITDFSSSILYQQECIFPNPFFMMGDNAEETISLGNVHHGFCKYYTTLADIGLPEYVIALSNLHPSYKIVLTGHSLGGAAAAIAAADLSTRFKVEKHRLSLYSFGSPRPGDLGFANLVSNGVDSAYRIVHSRDIVPSLPPCCIGLFSCNTMKTCPYHAATEVLYDNNMEVDSKFVVCSISYEDEACREILSLSIPDHQIYFGFQISTYCSKSPKINLIEDEENASAERHDFLINQPELSISWLHRDQPT